MSERATPAAGATGRLVDGALASGTQALASECHVGRGRRGGVVDGAQVGRGGVGGGEGGPGGAQARHRVSPGRGEGARQRTKDVTICLGAVRVILNSEQGQCDVDSIGQSASLP